MNKYQKQVLRKLPKAYLERDVSGYVYVMHDDEPIAAEYFFPETTNESDAWQFAAQALRVTQNFNRTHPDRMDLSDFESKSIRITKRLDESIRKPKKTNNVKKYFVDMD
jgi:hypothetical protein